jgi:hypothetical protein
MVPMFTELVVNQAEAGSEDESLWLCVEHEQAHRIMHPEELIVCDSDEALLMALDIVAFEAEPGNDRL